MNGRRMAQLEAEMREQICMKPPRLMNTHGRHKAALRAGLGTHSIVQMEILDFVLDTSLLRVQYLK